MTYTYKNVKLTSNWTANDFGIIWTGDLNGDGNTDVIITGLSFPPQGNAVQPGGVFLGDGVGNFSPAPSGMFPAIMTVHPRQIVSGDFNRDGRPDFFIASHGYDTAPFPGEQNHLYLSKADGTWSDETATLPQQLDFTHSAAVGDVNGDGALDIYVGNVFVDNIPPFILINDGTGHFSRSTTALPNQSGQFFDFAKGNFASALFADLNRDGRDDLIVGSVTGSVNEPSSVFWNTGSGFSQSRSTPLPDGQLPLNNRTVLSIASLDINNDGYLDLLTLSTTDNPYYVGTYIDAFLNQKGATFTNATAQVIGSAATRPTGGWSRFLDKMDVNGDGRLDVVMSQYSSSGATADSVFYLIDDGKGHLLPTTMGELTTAAGFQYDTVAFRTKDGIGFLKAYKTADGLFLNELLPSASTTPSVVTLTGTAGNDVLSGGAGAERLVGLGGNDTIDGGGGSNTSVHAGLARNYTITATAGGSSITVQDRSGLDGTDTVRNVQGLEFSDTTVDASSLLKAASLTPAQLASVTDIYIASFNRAPDALGLVYWAGKLKDGMSLAAIANSFFTQAETAAKYPSSTSNESFVATVYGNVLGRAPDADGLKYWTGQLAGGTISRDQFLLAILNGARANPGATLDIANLNNKVAVGEHFALAKGLNNGTWSQQVMAGVTSAASTVATANALTDGFSASAEAAGTGELVVKILGVVA